MAKEYEVIIDGKEFLCAEDEYIIDAAERAGLEIDYSCRAGACTSCVAKIIKGKVNQSEVSFLDEEQQKRFVLLCVAYPLDNCSFITKVVEELEPPFEYEIPWGNAEFTHHYFMGKVEVLRYLKWGC